MNRRQRSVLACRLGVLSIAIAAVGAGPAHAAVSKPAWDVRPASEPTNFAPGTSAAVGGFDGVPQYFVNVTNVGGAATSGTITVTTQLPTGITPDEPVATTNNENEIICPVVAQEVICEIVEPIKASAALQIFIPVSVPVDETSPLSTTVTVNGGGAATVQAHLETEVSKSPGPFGFLPGSSGFGASLLEFEGSSNVSAGGHPQQATFDLAFPTREGSGSGSTLSGGLVANGHLRDASVSLPRGMVVNPNATPAKCTEAELETEECPLGSQVGIVNANTSAARIQQYPAPLYNMVPPSGVAAEFAFEALGLNVFIHIDGSLRSNGNYELAASSRDILARSFNPIIGIQTQLWGNPSDPSHDEMRGDCVISTLACSHTVERSTTPLLTSPTACVASLSATAEADSWEAPGDFGMPRLATLTGASGTPVSAAGCDELDFSPTLSITPEIRSGDSPTGLSVNLHLPQPQSVKTFAEAHLKTVRATLPPGLVVNPASAGGLGACTTDQIDVGSTSSGSCPQNSKVGSVVVRTPLLDHSLPGSVYVATPRANPFGSFLALYLEVNDPQSGIVIKLPGRVDADQATGQLSAVFDENPQLPFEDLQIEFFGGPRATLRTPSTCGQYTSNAELVPWSGTPPVRLADAYSVSQGAGGKACAGSEAQLPRAAGFEAGTKTPVGGSYSPFVLRLQREDGTQQFKGLSVTLPPGLSGKLAGISYCPSEDLAAAGGKTGQEEISHPSCPSTSEIGSVQVGAGAGSQPYYVSGRAYLTGPYKGAPLGVAIITPAVAGPFDLGTVIVRSALFVDPLTAQITIKSDELPHILEGIPLDVRDVQVEVGRPQFTLNPTSCDRFKVTGEGFTLSDQTIGLSDRFQAGGCKALAFKPKLNISLKGATKRTGHPALKAVVQFPKNQTSANIARAQVGLPHSEFLDQNNLNKVCTQAELRTAACPKNSIYGHAKAWSPLLEKPLQGPVYLAVGFGYKLPALVADLNGQVRILLKGKVDTTKHKGIRSTFEAVPDASVSRFVLELKGGKNYGLLENSENICAKVQRANTKFVAQNGKVLQLHPKIANSCKKRTEKSTKSSH